MKLSVMSIKKSILLYMARNDIVSKAELLQLFELNSSTLTRLLDDLTSGNLIEECGLGQSTGGRKPILYQINAQYGYMLGLDISRTYSILGLFNMKLEPLDFVTWTMNDTMTPDRLLALLEQAVQHFQGKHSITHDKLLGIGIGAVGPLERTSGTIINPQYFHAPGWTDVPLRELIEQRLQLAAILDNGANTALLGEYWHDRSNEIKHMLYVHVGIGLRSAMMSGGQLVHGAVDVEDAFGQMIIQTDGTRLHPTSNYGALEAYASIQAMEKEARTQVKLGRNPLNQAVLAEQIDFQLLLKELREQNPYVEQLFEQAATYLGVGLANLINILHPEKIIVGGPLSHYSEIFFQTAIASAQRNIYHSPQYNPIFSRGQLGEKVVATGAATMVYDLLYL